MKKPKQEEKEELIKIAEQYVDLENFFVSAANRTPKVKTPQEMLQKISTLLKDFDGFELFCLYCRIRTLIESYTCVFCSEFTDEELDREIDSAHKRNKGKEGKYELLKTPHDYKTMRQDTKGSPEDETMANFLRSLGYRDN